MKEKGVGERWSRLWRCKQGVRQRGFRHAFGRFRSFSQVRVRSQLSRRDGGIADTVEGVQAWPCKGLPPWEPPRFSGDPLQFPLHLVPYRPASVRRKWHARSSVAEVSCRWFRAILGRCGRRSILPTLHGSVWLTVTEVLVESSVGSCAAVAQVSDGVRAGVVAMALGKGGVVDLVVPDEDRLSGVLAWQGTRVRVRKTS